MLQILVVYCFNLNYFSSHLRANKLFSKSVIQLQLNPIVDELLKMHPYLMEPYLEKERGRVTKAFN